MQPVRWSPASENAVEKILALKAQRADVAKLAKDAAWRRYLTIRREGTHTTPGVVRAYSVYLIASDAYEALVKDATIRWDGSGCQFWRR